MKKQVVIVEHQQGYFLAVNGDLSIRECEYVGKKKGIFSDADKYIKTVQQKYINYDVIEYFKTELDICMYPNNIAEVDWMYDPRIVNIDTGEVIQEQYEKHKPLTDRNREKAQAELNVILEGLKHRDKPKKKKSVVQALADFDMRQKQEAKTKPQPVEPVETKVEEIDTTTDLPPVEDIKETQKLIDIMKAKEETKKKRSEAAKRGWETKRRKQAEEEAKRLAEQQAIADEEFDKLWDEAIKENERYNELLNKEQVDEETILLRKIADITNEIVEWEQELEPSDNVDYMLSIEQTINKLKKKKKKLRKELDKKYPFNKQVEEVVPEEETTQTFSNSENPNEMETENQKAKPRRYKRGLQKGAEFGVNLLFDTAIGGGIALSDTIYTITEGLAWSKAVCIKPIGLHPDATLRELKDAAIEKAERNTAMLYAVPMAVAKMPGKIMAMKRASKEANDDNIVDISNVEVAQ